MSRIKIVAELHGDKIVLKAPYSQKERCQRLGGKWNRAAGAYLLPGTVNAAIAIKEAFPSEEFERIGNAEFAALAKRSREVEAAQVHKSREDLPDLPGRTEGWLHQRQAYWFAEGMDAAMLSMGMGSGKSRVVVGLAEGWKCSQVLVLCPSSVIDVWPVQFNGPLEIPDPAIVTCPACEGDPSCELCGGAREFLDKTRTKQVPYGHAERAWNVVALKSGTSVADRTSIAEQALRFASPSHPTAIVTNYEAAIREPFKSWALEQGWDLVDLDESHVAKSPGGVTSKFCAALGRRAKKRLCNTGTPMSHSPLDIYAQYRFLDPGVFGTSYFRFKQRYAIFGGFEGKKVVAYQNEEELAEKFGRLAYICASEDVLDLPEAMPPERNTCVLDAKTTKLYTELNSDLISDIEEGTVTAANALSRLLRLQQATSGHTRVDEREETVVVGEDKKKLLAEVLSELPVDEPVVVFTRFIHDARVVAEVCEEQGRRFGEVSGKGSDLVDAKFPSDLDVLAVQMQSGSLGIDLTRSAYAIYYSVGFSLGSYLQSLKRIHRPGQKRTTRYYHLIAEKKGEKASERETVDEVVFKALKAREQVVERVLREAKHG